MDPQLRLPDWETDMTVWIPGCIICGLEGGIAQLEMPEGFPDLKIVISVTDLQRVPSFDGSDILDWHIGQKVALTGHIVSITSTDTDKTLVVNFQGLPGLVELTDFQAWQCLSKTPPGVLMGF